MITSFKKVIKYFISNPEFVGSYNNFEDIESYDDYDNNVVAKKYVDESFSNFSSKKNACGHAHTQEVHFCQKGRLRPCTQVKRNFSLIKAPAALHTRRNWFKKTRAHARTHTHTNTDTPYYGSYTTLYTWHMAAVKKAGWLDENGDPTWTSNFGQHAWTGVVYICKSSQVKSNQFNSIQFHLIPYY